MVRNKNVNAMRKSIDNDIANIGYGYDNNNDDDVFLIMMMMFLINDDVF